jgi:hypothetical protein
MQILLALLLLAPLATWSAPITLPPNHTFTAVATAGEQYTLTFEYIASANSQLWVYQGSKQIFWAETLFALARKRIKGSATFVAHSATPALTFRAINPVIVDLVQLKVL